MDGRTSPRVFLNNYAYISSMISLETVITCMYSTLYLIEVLYYYSNLFSYMSFVYINRWLYYIQCDAVYFNHHFVYTHKHQSGRLNTFLFHCYINLINHVYLLQVMDQSLKSLFLAFSFNWYHRANVCMIV